MDNTEFLDVSQLAKRWGVHQQTLASWRRRDQGPKFIKTRHPIRILYSIIEIEEYEQQHPFLKK